MGRRKKPRTLREQLAVLLDKGDNRAQLMQAVVDKAIAGDMKAFALVREILENEPDRGGSVYRLELGPGVEDLSR